MLHLEPRHLKMVQSILQNISFPVFAFGSRTKKNYKKFSDLDLCVFGNVDQKIVDDLKDAFSLSDLPFFVDVVAWRKLDEDFQKIIKKNFILIHSGNGDLPEI